MASTTFPGTGKVLSPETAKFYQFIDTNMKELREEIDGYATTGRTDEERQPLTEDQIQKIFDDYFERLREDAERLYNDVKDDPNYIAGNWKPVGMRKKDKFYRDYYIGPLHELGIFDLIDYM